MTSYLGLTSIGGEAACRHPTGISTSHGNVYEADTADVPRDHVRLNPITGFGRGRPYRLAPDADHSITS